MPEQQSFPELFVQKIVGDYKAYADGLASQLGGTSDTRRYSTADQLTMWNASPIADPQQRAQAMLEMHQQGMHPEDITDRVYPQRRNLITAGRPDVAEQIKYAQQMDRLMARKALDAGIHFPHDEVWAQITAPNAPQPQDASSASMGLTDPATAAVSPAPAGIPVPAGAPTAPTIDVQPTQATSTPWSQQTGSLF